MTDATIDNGLHAFAFLTGRWRVRHRKLNRRLAGDTTWTEFEGQTEAWEILGGAGNLDDNWLDDPSGPYSAATLRRIDPATGLWSIWWFDSRASAIDPPVIGRFENGVGTFHGDDHLDGGPIRVRFVWSDITASRARWEQAFSSDAGRAWEVNWVMIFERTP